MKMTRFNIGGLVVAVAVVAGGSLRAAEGWSTYRSKPGRDNKISVSGTSTVHDWTVEGLIIAGQLEVGPNFPTEPGKAKPGKLEAKADVAIPVRSLKSMHEGKPYSNSMDDIMYEKLLETDHKRIQYSLKELTLKEAPQAGQPLSLESKGDLEVAGVTKEITMPIEMTFEDKGALKFTGEVTLKMTDFNIEPPAPKLALGAIKTGDEVKLGIIWVTIPRK